MRVLMLATGPFAVPTLAALLASSHTVVGLVTQPVRATGRKASQTPETPLRALARTHGLPIFDPDRINRRPVRAPLIALRPEVLVVADYGQILNENTLAMAPHGGINLHGSLLPKYRGAAPINWSLYDGDTLTGITVIRMNAGLDAGPMLRKAELTIDPADDALSLETRLANLGAGEVVTALDQLAAGTAHETPQDHAAATVARMLAKTDGVLDFNRPAVALRNQIRALVPWPKCFTFWHRPQGEPLRMIVGPVTVQATSQPAAPGTVLVAAGNQLVVATGDQALQFTTLQPANKRELSIAEFLRGYPVRVGETFGPAPSAAV